MCFTIHLDHTEKKVSDGTITCFKVLNRTGENKTLNFVAPYMETSYGRLSSNTKRVFKLNKKRFKTYTKRTNRDVNFGLHSFSELSEARDMIKDDWQEETLVILLCTIPKGEEYYYNPKTKQYVSTGLKFEAMVAKIS